MNITLYVIWLKSTSGLTAYSNKSQSPGLRGVSASLSLPFTFLMALAVWAVVLLVYSSVCSLGSFPFLARPQLKSLCAHCVSCGLGCCAWCLRHVTTNCSVWPSADTGSGKMTPQLCQVPTCTAAAFRGAGDSVAGSELRAYQTILILRSRGKPFTLLVCFYFERE